MHCPSFKSCLLGLCLLLGACVAAQAEPLAIIVAPDHPLRTADRATLAGIFKRKQRVAADGSALVPVNLPAEDARRGAFSRAVFALSPADLDSYWNERYFHGISPPHVVHSVEAMLRFVAATPGAIGYVPACHVDARVRVLVTLPTPLAACGDEPAR